MLRDGSREYHVVSPGNYMYRAAFHVTTCQLDQSGGISYHTGLGFLSRSSNRKV
jgi:hypothetical protein